MKSIHTQIKVFQTLITEGTQGFEKVYMMLEEACSIIAEKLQNDR